LRTANIASVNDQLAVAQPGRPAETYRPGQLFEFLDGALMVIEEIDAEAGVVSGTGLDGDWKDKRIRFELP
jgi:hypothetical protein